MQQVKIFKSLEAEVGRLEKDINAWLAQSHARVIHIFGNIAPQSETTNPGSAALTKHVHACSDVIIVVLYELPN